MAENSTYIAEVEKNSDIQSLYYVNMSNGSELLSNETLKTHAVMEMKFKSPPLKLEDIITLPFYTLIFLLSIVGNLLVIITLIQNKRMRTVTNVFLLNLSISDLLLAVFCMPFTIVPVMLKNFIFGATICILIRYLQSKSLYFILINSALYSELLDTFNS
jgi:hypothetical protein